MNGDRGQRVPVWSEGPIRSACLTEHIYRNSILMMKSLELSTESVPDILSDERDGDMG